MKEGKKKTSHTPLALSDSEAFMCREKRLSLSEGTRGQEMLVKYRCRWSCLLLALKH